MKKRYFLVLMLSFVFCFEGAQGQYYSARPYLVYPGKAIPITITGQQTHFKNDPAHTTISFFVDSYRYTPKSVDIISDNEIHLILNLPDSAPTGLYSYKINDHTVDSAYESETIYVYPTKKTALSITPDTVYNGSTGLQFIITVSNSLFDDTYKTQKIWLQKDNTIIHTVSLLTFSTEAIITTNISPATPSGSYDLYAKDTIDSLIVLKNAVYINSNLPPSIISISPDTARQGNYTTFHIYGSHCHFGKDFTLVRGDLIKGKDTLHDYIYSNSSFSPNELSCQIHPSYDMDTGWYTIRVKDAYDGTMISPARLHILMALGRKIVSYDRHGAYPGSVFTMRISTTNTKFTAGGAKVWLSQNQLRIAARNITVINDRLIDARFYLPSDLIIAAGTWDLNVDDTTNQPIILKQVFQILYPQTLTLLSVSPDTLFRGITTTLDVKGIKTSFNNASKFFLIRPDGSPLYATVAAVISPTEIKINMAPDAAFNIGEVILIYGDTLHNYYELDERMYIDHNSAINPANPPGVVALNAYPNPFRNTFTLTYDLPEASDINIQVFDLMGRQVWHETPGRLPAGRHDTEIRFDGSESKSGMYVVRLQAGNSVLETIALKVE